MNKLTEAQREALAVLSLDNSGIYEDASFHERMLIGSERIHSVMLQSEHPEKLRVLVVAPRSDHGWWGSPKYREHQAPAGVDLPVRILGSHKADPPEWNESLLREDGPGGIWVISWESMRGHIPSKDKRPGYKVSGRDISLAMSRGTIPPWSGTGTWDLIIAEDAQHMAFRNTLQRKVLQTVKTRNKLALSDNASSKHPEGLWGVLNWLWPDQYPNYWKWVKAYFDTDPVKWPGRPEYKVLSEKMPGCNWFDVPCSVRRSS